MKPAFSFLLLSALVVCLHCINAACQHDNSSYKIGFRKTASDIKEALPAGNRTLDAMVSGRNADTTKILFKSHAYEIEPLTAFPSAWKTGFIHGLMVRGGFEVNINRGNSKLKQIKNYQ
ncbi:MAG: glycoside hydrolase family 95-like protein [Bacteroidales bacterium]